MITKINIGTGLSDEFIEAQHYECSMADLMFNFRCGLKTDDPRHTLGGRQSNDPWVVSIGFHDDEDQCLNE